MPDIRNAKFNNRDLDSLIKEGVAKEGIILISPLIKDFESIYVEMKDEFINQEFELTFNKEKQLILLRGYGFFPKENIQWNSWNVKGKIYYFDYTMDIEWIKGNILKFIEFLGIKYITKKRLKKIKKVYNKILDNKDIIKIKDLYTKKEI